MRRIAAQCRADVGILYGDWLRWLSSGEDRRQMAGRALGELVRKMGDRVVKQIVPILQVGGRRLQSERVP